MGDKHKSNQLYCWIHLFCYANTPTTQSVSLNVVYFKCSWEWNKKTCFWNNLSHTLAGPQGCSNMWTANGAFWCTCVVLLTRLTLKHGSSTLRSLVTGSPGTTAFIIEILSCQVALRTCQGGLKGTALAVLLSCSAWFFIALHSRPIRRCFQTYVSIIHFLWWQLLTVTHCATTSSQNLVYLSASVRPPVFSPPCPCSSLKKACSVR